MATIEITADQPDSQACSTTTREWGTRDRWNVECTTHQCQARNSYPDERSAREAFVCDLGQHWLFIVHQLDDHVPPDMVDLTGLVEVIRTHLQNEALSVPSLLMVLRYQDVSLRAVDIDVVATDENQWSVRVSDNPDDARGLSHAPETYLTFHHTLE